MVLPSLLSTAESIKMNIIVRQEDNMITARSNTSNHLLKNTNLHTHTYTERELKVAK